jgi:hypothetical protein
MTILCGMLLLFVAMPGAGAQQHGNLQLTILDPDGNRLPGAQIAVRLDGRELSRAAANDEGIAVVSDIPSATYEVLIEKVGFHSCSRTIFVDAQGAAVEVTLLPKLTKSEQVEVHADVDGPAEDHVSASQSLQREEVKSLPARPAAVTDALPLVPGVTRSQDGEISIDGGAEHNSAYLVNGADVTDPGTGRFGLSIPVDSVEFLAVMKSPFLAEYGRFTTGVVTAETRRGGEKWHFELNDPFPGFRIRSMHLRGVREASPRLSFGGPLLGNKLYFNEGFQYSLKKEAVRTLPFPYNQSEHESVNSFSQFDYILSATHFLTVATQVAQQHTNFANLTFFMPEPVSPSFRASERLSSFIDHLALGTTLLSSTLSVQMFDAGTGAQGNADMVLTPTGNLGNYYLRESRDASRVQWNETASRSVDTRFGTNDLKFGSEVSHSSGSVLAKASPVDIRDAQGQLLEQIAFAAGLASTQVDTETALYGQDHWRPAKGLAFDWGLRVEHQSSTGNAHLAPRVGAAWTPFRKRLTTFRGGFGTYYDRVPLNVLYFAQSPEQVITTYGPAGLVVSGPNRYLHLGDPTHFSPRAKTWSLEWEQTLSSKVMLRVNYLQTTSHRVITISPGRAPAQYAYVLTGHGQSSYRQLEATSKVRWSKGRETFLSYVRSRSQGDLNEFGQFLGDFPSPIIRQNQFTRSPEDLPNRFLAWGSFSLPWRFAIYPTVEYRTGAPYAPLDALRNYVGVPYSDRYRFPDFFSADTRVSKDVPVGNKYALRFALSGFNLTNHFNALDVHANVADPSYGIFFGNNRRRFEGDFDVLF